MNIKEIDSRLEELKNQLDANEGRRAEVYSRIVGYYRSVKNWNKGKKEEFAIRKTYNVKCEPEKMTDLRTLEAEIPAEKIQPAGKQLIQEIVEVTEPETKEETYTPEPKAAESAAVETTEVERAAKEVESEDTAVNNQGDLFMDQQESQSAAPEVSYRFYYRQDCPNCPPVKNLMEDSSLTGTAIDVDQEEGLQMAVEDNVYSAPTVVFVDGEGKELFRGDKAGSLEEYMNSVAEAVTV